MFGSSGGKSLSLVQVKLSCPQSFSKLDFSGGLITSEFCDVESKAGLCVCAVTNRLALQEEEFKENNPLKRGVFSISVGDLLNLI